MLISNISFSPPVGESDVAKASVTFDGILNVEAYIFRMKNIPGRRSELMVKWDDSVCWTDDYTEQRFTWEVLDRYYDFQEAQRDLI